MKKQERPGKEYNFLFHQNPAYCMCKYSQDTGKKNKERNKKYED